MEKINFISTVELEKIVDKIFLLNEVKDEK